MSDAAPPALAGIPPLPLPTPRRLERTGGWLALHADAAAWINSREAFVPTTRLPAQVACRVTGAWCGAGSVDAQSYRLRIGVRDCVGGIEIDSPSAVGVRHARATLRQLLAQYGTMDSPRLPTMEIEDSPAFATRGVMLDVSRCRIPTMGEFARIIDALSDLKCNHLQLYTEHTFAYTGHEGVWRGWDPITPDEARTLDAMCNARGIELAANQNCFGHLAHWLKLPEYAHLAETHGEWVFDVWPRSGPFSLCPTDGASVVFVRDLLGQLLPCFSSGLVNIGCDETYDIAFGRSKEEVTRRGRAAVYMEFVEKVCEVVRDRKKRPMFWGDIALSHPESAESIPEDAIALAWGYEPDSPFAAWCNTLRGAGREAWVCPGTSSWCSVAGRTGERRANIERAAREGLAGDATGLLICDWGDFGHWQQWPVAMRGIADGLAAGWSGGTLPDARAVSLHTLGDATLGAAAWLDALGEVDAALRETCLGISRPGMSGRLRNQSAIFADMRVPLMERGDVGAPGEWEAVWRELGRVHERGCAGLAGALRDECEHTARLTRALCARAMARRGLVGVTMSQACEMMRESYREHERLWRERCRGGGLKQSGEFFERVIGEMEGAK
jgi:hypothetical protein